MMRRWLWRLRGTLGSAPAAAWLSAVCLFVFVVQRLAGRVEFAYGYSFGSALEASFGLNGALLAHGFFWQPLSYLFLHENGLHLAFNVLTLFLFGSGVEREIGSRRFLKVFFAGGLAAGLGWLAAESVASFLPSMAGLTQWMPPGLRQWLGADVAAARGPQTGLLIGASGAVFALIGAFAALYPRRIVYVVLLVFPLRLQARTLVLLLVGLDIGLALFVQVRIAHAAHLTGCLVGALIGWRLRRSGAAGEGWSCACPGDRGHVRC